MVQSKGQHGKGKLVSDDPIVDDLKKRFGGDRKRFKEAAKGELNKLEERARQTNSAKERNKLLRRKDAIKGAIKLMDRELLKTPFITLFTDDQFKKLIRGFNPYSPTT
jgi:hypothetical protein